VAGARVSPRLPETGSFEHLLTEVRVPVEKLVRLSRFPRTEPHWSRGLGRFDAPLMGSGDFGTCYAAGDVAVAFSESVIRATSWFSDGRFQVPRAELVSRYVVSFDRPARPMLRLVDLTGSALKKLGLNNDISAGDDFTVSMAWSAGIHASDRRWDGIRYVSRQANDSYAYALFERSGVVKARSRKLTQAELDRLCDQYGVAVI